MRTIAQRLRHLASRPDRDPSQHAIAGVHRRLGRSQDAGLSEAVRRRLEAATSNAERFVALQEEVQEHLADGTLVMGRHSYAAPRVRKYKGDTNRVLVGDFCSLAPDADFYVGGRHPIDWVSCYGLREMFDLPGAYQGRMPHSKGDIVVGNDCWITDGATVVSGVTIGDGAVVGTKAVVAKDVRPYAIMVGNPAREIGRRFSDEQVEALLRIRWWDWSLDDILARVDDLNGTSIDDFIKQYDPGTQA